MSHYVTPAQGEHVKAEVFEKVELAYGLGLRAADPTIRAKFYALWNKAIPASLFERLRHVIMGQNWEEMGNTFWLKQAVVSSWPVCFSTAGVEL